MNKYLLQAAAQQGTLVNLPFKNDLLFHSKLRSGLSLVAEVGDNASILNPVVKSTSTFSGSSFATGVNSMAATIWVFKGKFGAAPLQTRSIGQYNNFGIQHSPSNQLILVWGNKSNIGIACDGLWHTYIIYDKRLWIASVDLELTDASILNVINTVTPSINQSTAVWDANAISPDINYFGTTIAYSTTVNLTMSVSYIGAITTGVITWSRKHLFQNTDYVYDILNGANSIRYWNDKVSISVDFSANGSPYQLDSGHSIYHNAAIGILNVPYANGLPSSGTVPSGFVKIHDIAGDSVKHNLGNSIIRFPLGSAWDRSNTTIYKAAARTGFYDAANPTDWHVTELNQLAMNELWFNTGQDIAFVKMSANSVDVDDRVKLIELFSYATPKTGSDLTKVLQYTGDYPYFL